MTNMGHLHYYICIEVTHNSRYIIISQKKYVGELLNRFGIVVSNRLSTRMEQNLKLTSNEGKEFEDAPKYKELGGALSTLPLPNQIFHLQLGSFLGSCKNLVKNICVLQKRVLRYCCGHNNPPY